MITRVNIAVQGAVQGVGFRPFIYNLAIKLKVFGFVRNNSSGVFIEAEGEELTIRKFLFSIEKEKPRLAFITSFEHTFLDPIGYQSFVIKESESRENKSAIVLPDISTCSDCLNEIWNPRERRYRYPFTNCTNCGPRFSIIKSLPYDRKNTSMKSFMMCSSCREEYENPNDRRFHAQPIACPDCGPQLSLSDKKGKCLCIGEEALQLAVKKITEGRIVAIKGLGGFQLVCDASNDDAVKNLRRRKKRNAKPFALMFGSLDSVKEICEVSSTERRILLSPESPITLLKVKLQTSNIKRVSFEVAPNNPYLGIMLPYSPLHHLIMEELKNPIVATSGNLSEEPICIDNDEARERLNGIADYFLVHNRPIVRHVDDSIVRCVMKRELVLRRARGYAPLPLIIDKQNSYKSILALGGHLKNTISLKKDNNVFVSQHIGDLSTKESNEVFKKVIDDFLLLYNTKLDLVICDSHPDYFSTKYSEALQINTMKVQHHSAHTLACRLENQVEGDALGVSWDGTGYGDDGTIWGGEFFRSSDLSIEHIAQFRQFKLPGGEIAIKEPRRSLAGIFYEMGLLDDHASLKLFKPNDLKIIISMLSNNYNSPLTSSAGRLFDGVSALLSLCSFSEFEGQAAMLLEFQADVDETAEYKFEIVDSDNVVVDWRPIIKDILKDMKNNAAKTKISAKFHNTLARIIYETSEYFNLNKVILSGGCFQNKFLLEGTIKLLRKKNKKVYWHQRIPANDGGISVGQIAQYMLQQK